MRFRLAATAAVIAVALAASTAAATGSDGSEASVANPFAACPIGPDVFAGVNYPNTEPEGWLARNPRLRDNLVGAFQQDRWSDGGAKGLVVSWTFDDGRHWGVSPLPFSKCAAPFYRGRVLQYDRASDPWVDVGPDGKAYSVSISFNANDNNNAVGAATSSDGGVTWQNTQEIIHDVDADPTEPFNDKESVTADPVRAGWAYAVWDRLVDVACGPNTAPRAPINDERPASSGAAGLAAPAQAEVCFEGPTFFSRTTDGGRTWSTPIPIVGNLPDEQTIANQIVVDLRTDTLYNFYVYFPATGAPELRMISSTNGGTTWSPQQLVDTLQSVGITDPQTGAPARTGDIIPVPAIDPNTGQLYLAWQDARYNPNGEDDVVVSTSKLGGLTGTWTVPQRVDLPQDRAGFTPGIKVNNRGQLAIDYYSMRPPDDGPDVWPIDLFVRTTSGPATVLGTTARFDFSRPDLVTGPFNLLMAPDAGGFFLGDYQGMAVDRDGRLFHTYFGQTNCDSTRCPAVGVPAPDTGTSPTPSPRPDPFDVYSTIEDAFGR